MKKVFKLIVICVTFLSLMGYAKANSISLSLEDGSNEFDGNTFTIYVKVNASNNMAGALFPITYDSSKVTVDLSKSEGQNDFSLAIDKNVVLDSHVEKTGEMVIAKLVFNTTDSFKVGESVTITLGDGYFSDYEKLTSIKGSSITVEKIEKVKGDWNENGELDLPDLVKCRRYLAGFDDATLPSNEIADFNSDGNVDLTDLVVLRRYFANGY